MFIEGQERAFFARSEIEIIGRGTIGVKAMELVRKTPSAREVGFLSPRRIALAQGFLDPFFAENGFGESMAATIPQPNLAAQILTARMPEAMAQTLTAVAADFPESPILVARSSADKDAIGIGIYASEFVFNTGECLAQGVQAVLASYFSETAVVFRQLTKSGSGFGVIIEPMLGQWIGDTLLPPLSGYGYTSSPVTGEAFVVAVPGLGSAVETRLGEKISPATYGESPDLLSYINQERQKIFHDKVSPRASALLRMKFGRMIDVEQSYPGKGYRIGEESPTGSVSVPLQDMKKPYQAIQLSDLFNQLAELEAKLHTPQYIEWAITADPEPRIWLLQIADALAVDRNIEFKLTGEIVTRANFVRGSGIKDCPMTVFCMSFEDIPRLRELNKTITGYQLVYGGSLIIRENLDSQLQLGDFSNAAVVLEFPGVIHARTPIAHFGGQSALAGKSFAVINESFSLKALEDRLGKLEKMHGLTVSTQPVRVYAREATDELVVEKISE